MRILAVLLAAVALPAAAWAHPLDIASLRLAPAGELVDVAFDATLGTPGALALTPEAPCRAVHQQDDVGLLRVTIRGRWDCGAGGVDAARGRIRGAAERRLDTVVRVTTDRGTRTTLARGEPWAASAAPPGHVRSGVVHILTGADHLLFVALLLVLAPGARALVTTITAFTVGHSVTLAVATLGGPSPAPAPTEALIAASVLFAAAEAARPADARGLLGGRPALAALAFGLLHGFGFAGALDAAGLPPDAAPAALLGFNVGVEIGQLAFVVVCASIARVLPLDPRRPLAYGAGAWAAYLLLGRLAALG